MLVVERGYFKIVHWPSRTSLPGGASVCNATLGLFGGQLQDLAPFQIMEFPQEFSVLKNYYRLLWKVAQHVELHADESRAHYHNLHSTLVMSLQHIPRWGPTVYRPLVHSWRGGLLPIYCPDHRLERLLVFASYLSKWLAYCSITHHD